MTSLEQWLMNGVYILGIVVFVFVWLLFLKSRYANAVVGKLLSEFITREGNSYTKLLPITNGTVTIPPKGNQGGRQYVIADIATYTVDYPAVPRFLSIIQTKAKKATFFEDSYEPITNRGYTLLLSPRRLYNLVNEQFTELGVRQARDEAVEKKFTQKNSFQLKTSHVVYGVIGIAIVALLIYGIYMMKNFTTLQQGLGG